MPKKHVEVFRQYCFDCHDSATKEGNVDLETISLEISRDNPTAKLWDDILAALNAGEMPPRDAEQISPAEKTAFLTDLSVQMVLARNILSDSGGEITMRRLNRREYQNTMDSLLGFRPDVSTLPDDDGTGGFDTSGASLFFSSDQFEQYRATATHSINHVLARRKKSKPSTIRLEGEDLVSKALEEVAAKTLETYENAVARTKQPDRPPTDFGFRDEAHAKKQLSQAIMNHKETVYYVDRPEAKSGAVMHNIKGRPPVLMLGKQVRGGKYKIRVRAGCYENAPERERYLSMQFSTSNKTHSVLGHVKIPGTLKKPSTIEFIATHPGHENGGFSIQVRDYKEKSARYAIYRKWREKNGVGKPPSIWIDYIEVEGPFFDEELHSNQKTLLPKRDKSETQESYARRVITDFATRAFRGTSPSPEFAGKLTARYLAKIEQDVDEKVAIVDPLALVLSSPSFLYMIEPRGENEKAIKLSDRELAIRLSYFLWSSPPDEELMTLAKQKKLSDAKVLSAQTTRLLNDPRSDAFVSSFAHQWLDMTRLDMFEFDAKYHPEFDEAIRQSARKEVYATIRHLIEQKLPLETLLKADFVIVDDILADFYGLAGITGSEFRQVSLPVGSPRGGILGTAAFHIMGSDGQRSSPVERGAWVLRHLLHDPPPPAPANIPMLSRLEGKVLSVRQLQRAHQEEPQCAQCHQKIDPIGYGLENFTAAGLWREVEKVELPKMDGKNKRSGLTKFKDFAIDTSGVLPRGEHFADYFELRDAVTSYREPFARGFTEHLIAYGLGRPYAISDHNLATSIAEKAEKDGNLISSFVHALVQSEAFHKK